MLNFKVCLTTFYRVNGQVVFDHQEERGNWGSRDNKISYRKLTIERNIIEEDEYELRLFRGLQKETGYG
jgi:hypothetical protein